MILCNVPLTSLSLCFVQYNAIPGVQGSEACATEPSESSSTQAQHPQEHYREAQVRQHDCCRTILCKWPCNRQKFEKRLITFSILLVVSSSRDVTVVSSHLHRRMKRFLASTWGFRTSDLCQESIKISDCTGVSHASLHTS